MAGITVVNDDLSKADQAYGYRFGCDGLVDLEEAARMLGGCHTSTVERRLQEGLFRRGRDKGRLVICKRSLLEYIASLES